MKRRLFPLVILALAAAVGGVNSEAVGASDDAKPSVTVFPVVATPNGFPDEFAKRVGIVVATFLERAGLEDLQVADTMFNPPETEDVKKIAQAFGKKVKDEAVATDYAVFTQFLGTPKTGVKGIRTIVVDKSGKVLLAESAGDAEFDKIPLRPKDPMTCCAFVGRRLQEFWKLEDPLRANAPKGNMARFWQKDAGFPEQDELDAINKRAEKLRRNVRAATCTVYPVRLGRQSDRQCAVDLVAMLNEAGLCQAQAADIDPALEIAGHSNEQKVLWDTARAFRDFVKKKPPTTDYAVFADYGLFGSRVHHVHVIVCDRSGDWVLIDMQNSHHRLFARIDPSSAADCNQLLVTRLKDWENE